jgi:glyoxylase-like metal-dependent hydrolase (beta-lactamase superfamily II)
LLIYFIRKSTGFHGIGYTGDAVMEGMFDIVTLKVGYGGFYNYSYLGIDKSSGHAFIVDPAWELNLIVETLKKNHAVLKMILLTHSHFDHVNLVNQLVKIFNPCVYMSNAEIDYYGFNCANLRPMRDMDELCMGATKILCLLTPGHTKGGMCYWIGNNIFTGDTVFIEGCGVCSNFGASADEMYKSIQKIKNIVHLDTYVYPGHSYGKDPGKTLEYLFDTNIYCSAAVPPTISEISCVIDDCLALL